MDDDFNTPVALACLYELIDLALGFVSCDKADAFRYAKLKIEIFFLIFGLSLKEKEELPNDVVQLGLKRRQVRENRDFENADMIRHLLSGEKGQRREVVVMNAAAALVAGNRASDLKEGARLAEEAIDSRRASAKLDGLVRLSQSLG